MKDLWDNSELNFSQLFKAHSEQSFNDTALKIFRYQYEKIDVYRSYVDQLSIHPETIDHSSKIPFLPIQFFKSHSIFSGSERTDIVFESSGTQQQGTSKHHVQDISIYIKSFESAFEYFFGPASDYCILALLPSYLEREGSSLIFMMDQLIKNSAHVKSGFYLDDFSALHSVLKDLNARKQKTILLGVTFALLDFAEEFSTPLENIIIMETGGMKGRREELLRQEVHEKLTRAFGTDSIHSEYGMTELLSQAYSLGQGLFQCPPWMRVHTRDLNDPLSRDQRNKTGGINIIDFANLHSCSFIATQDLGRVHDKGYFEIIGRFDESDIRGCNLMVA
ncbi:MAG: acyl transferase [Bacteroidota bacterium]